MADYISKFTGQEIDDSIQKAKDISKTKVIDFKLWLMIQTQQLIQQLIQIGKYFTLIMKQMEDEIRAKLGMKTVEAQEEE